MPLYFSNFDSFFRMISVCVKEYCCIQIGGIGALVPEKRAWLTELGVYAVLGGALANLLNAMVVSLLI